MKSRVQVNRSEWKKERLEIMRHQLVVKRRQDKWNSREPFAVQLKLWDCVCFPSDIGLEFVGEKRDLCQQRFSASILPSFRCRRPEIMSLPLSFASEAVERKTFDIWPPFSAVFARRRRSIVLLVCGAWEIVEIRSPVGAWHRQKRHEPSCKVVPTMNIEKNEWRNERLLNPNLHSTLTYIMNKRRPQQMTKSAEKFINNFLFSSFRYVSHAPTWREKSIIKFHINSAFVLIWNGSRGSTLKRAIAVVKGNT